MTTTDPAVDVWTSAVHDARDRLYPGRHRGTYDETADRVARNGTRLIPRHLIPSLTRAAAIGLIEDYVGDAAVEEIGLRRALVRCHAIAAGDPRALRQLDDAATVLGLKEVEQP